TTALAEAVHLDTSTVSRQVGSLVRHGLVERQADPADGRASLLVATASGKERFDQHKQARACQLQDMLAHWSAVDLGAFADMFGRLNNEFEQYEQQHSHDPNPDYVKGGTR